MLTKKALLLAFCSLVLPLCPLLYGQANGSFSGTVTDKSRICSLGGNRKSHAASHRRNSRIEDR